MAKYVIKRLVLLIPVMLGVALAIDHWISFASVLPSAHLYCSVGVTTAV